MRNGERQSCHSGLSICLFSIGVRPVWWEKSKVCHMLSLKTMHNDSQSEAISPNPPSSHSFLIIFAQYQCFFLLKSVHMLHLGEDFFFKALFKRNYYELFFFSRCSFFSITLHFHVLGGGSSLWVYVTYCRENVSGGSCDCHSKHDVMGNRDRGKRGSCIIKQSAAIRDIYTVE